MTDGLSGNHFEWSSLKLTGLRFLEGTITCPFPGCHDLKVDTDIHMMIRMMIVVEEEDGAVNRNPGRR